MNYRSLLKRHVRYVLSESGTTHIENMTPEKCGLEADELNELQRIWQEIRREINQRNARR